MSKKKVFFVAWYFNSFTGGAEKSIFEELKKYQKKGYIVEIICFDEMGKFGKFKIEGIEGYNFSLKYNFSFLSRYLTLYLNKNYFLSILKKNKSKLLNSNFIITQSINAPIISNFCYNNNIFYHYYLRDEGNLNIFKNYNFGFKKYLKFVKDLMEFPFKSFYSKQNRFALEHATQIISNSEFISNKLKLLFNLNSKVILPKIDYSKLNKNKMNLFGEKYITFIGGGNPMKGEDIVLKIAKKLPAESFLIVGNYNKKFKKNNLTFVPNVKDIMDVFIKSKIILMPSRCNEAFGRLPLEARYLNIPILTSGNGGLPESNEIYDNIINDLENINLWVNRINYLLNKNG